MFNDNALRLKLFFLLITNIKKMSLKEQQPVQKQQKKSVKKTPKKAPIKIEEQNPLVDTTETSVVEDNEPQVVEEPKDNKAVNEEQQSLSEKIMNTLSFVSSMIKELKVVESELKTIKTLYQKEAKKNLKKRKSTKTTKNGSHGFVKAVKISKELADFLEVDHDTLISRPQVTSAISKYVKANNLANPEKKSIFKTDAKLKKILGEPRFLIDSSKPELGEGFSYFNLQSYMRDHFIKEPVQ